MSDWKDQQDLYSHGTPQPPRKAVEESNEGDRESPSRDSLEFVDLAQEKHGVTDYPLRNPEEDQKWAVVTVRLWAGIASAIVLFITVLLVLGATYD